MDEDDYVEVSTGGLGVVWFGVLFILAVYLGAMGVVAWYVMENTHQIAENTSP